MTKKRSSAPTQKGSTKTPLTIIFALLVVGALFLMNQSCFSTDPLDAPPPTRSQSGVITTVTPPGASDTGTWYQLYFTTPQYPDKPETRSDTVPNGLINVIDSAQETLDIAIYELNLEGVGEAILAARDRGVKVRLVTDTDELELETLIHLEEEGIPLVSDERGPIMHNKFVVVDGAAVWTGSWNFTPNDTYRNNNHALFIQSPQLAENYTTEFEEMFTQHKFGPTSTADTPNPQVRIGDTLIESCFAPEDECAVKLTQVILQAQQEIYFMAFSFTHDEIGQAVLERAKAGVEVHGVFETRGSETEYSELARMKKAGLDVLQDGNPYTLHHKLFIIDGEVVVSGSFNFSSNADEANDENMLVIHNAEIAHQFLAEFERVYAQAESAP
jgi:phosphatidylserine/phosphatidylglycerophosphate/cardiolipin synthase-like enzyme